MSFIVYMRCTCIVHNIFFLFCVLKVLNLTCSGFQSTCFWQQVASLSVWPLALALSPERCEVRSDALIPVHFPRPVRKQCSVIPLSHGGRTLVGQWKPSRCVCVQNGFPCSCGASSYSWLHTWPCPALPVPAPAGRGLCSKPRLGKHRFVRTLMCPGVFSKLKLFVIIIRIIIDFYRLSLLFFGYVFGFFFFFKKKKVGVLLID